MKMNKTNDSKTVAIGDVHGHYRELIELLDKLEHDHNIDFEKDTLVFLGDYVDGGPNTKDVLDHLIYLKETYPHFKFLYGNHEDLLIDAMIPHHPVYGDYDMWFNQGGKETLISYSNKMGLDYYKSSLIGINDALPAKHLEFIKNLDTYYETDNYFFVHAGVKSEPLEQVKKTMTRFDMIWIRDSFIFSKYDWGKKIIFGHTINDGRYSPGFLSPIIKNNKIGIDTFAHNRGKLTAVILPNEEFVYTQFTDNAAEA